MDTKEIHIGESIKKKLKEKERSEAWLARQVNCDPGNFNRLLRRKSIDMELLCRISVIMDFNFCYELYKEVQIQIEEKQKKVCSQLRIS